MPNPTPIDHGQPLSKRPWDIRTLSRIFKALSNPESLEILHVLKNGPPMTAEQIEEKIEEKSDDDHRESIRLQAKLMSLLSGKCALRILERAFAGSADRDDLRTASDASDEKFDRIMNRLTGMKVIHMSDGLWMPSQDARNLFESVIAHADRMRQGKTLKRMIRSYRGV